jgi:small-conductance mechanosensitive channel
MRIDSISRSSATVWLRIATALAITCSQLGIAAEPPAAQSAPTVAPAQAPVRVANREVALMRATLLGVTPAERARRADHRIAEVLERGGPGVVTSRAEPPGEVILIDGELALILLAQDADESQGETLESVTRQVVAALQRAIAETREGRDRRHLLYGAMYSLVATGIALVLALGVWRLRRWLSSHIAALLAAKTARMQLAGAPLLHSSRMLTFSRWLANLASWALLSVILYEWTTYVLTRFPYTRVWGEQLEGFLVGVLVRMGGGILDALPNLVVAVAIFALARVLTVAARTFFDRVERGQARIAWLDRDMAGPTRRLFAVAIWLFAVVMAYPYLPGADSEAFKGVSVLVGLMITLGGSSLIGQAASGLILMYSRTLRVGEYVRVGENEGTVSEVGTFTTKLRTGMGDEVTLPNALVLGTVTRNYSRAVTGPGYVVDTTVTIGYDTPWRQVEAMLIAAAKKTAGVLSVPEPRVYQTGLSDFYVEYRLVAQAVPSEPRPRAEVLNALHANVQDVFNDCKVQIMSPHYLGDPARPKVVPRDGWFAAPAKEPPA